MKSRYFRHLAVAATILALASCSTYKNINYIQDVEANVAEEMTINKGILIQPQDQISIIVSSRNPELATMFNLTVSSLQSGSESYGQQRVTGYVVDNDGNIDFPILGTVKAAGMTRWDLANDIKSKLLSGGLLTDAIVSVQFINFKVSILGEVTNPGTYNIEDDKITLLQALSRANDLTIFGRRDCVYVIREKDGERTTYKVDLRSVEMFDSPAYYLQQNDVVYVEPNKVRAGQSTINENNIKSVNLWVSIGSFLTTIATLVISVLASKR